MKPITKLYEDQVFNAQSAPTYYRNRADLLQPAAKVFPSSEFKTITKILFDDSLMGTKGSHYFMADKDHVVSLLVSEQPSRRYVITLSSTGDANDFFISLKDYDHVLDFLSSLKINIDEFEKSKLK